jgi:hypothetical protein
MGEATARRALQVLVGLLLLAGAGPTCVAGEVDPWMPETLPAFIRALELGIEQNLTPRERTVLASRTREELRETHPELHEKIRQCFSAWTDEWVRRATREIEGVSASRMRRAEQAAAEVDDRLRAYFDARGWKYRPVKVVFLPHHLMVEPGRPSMQTRGMYLLYYPDVFFASLGAHATLRHTLIHESLHFNKTGAGLGRPLSEGIAEAAATQLGLEWDMVRKRALRDAGSYAKELQIVNYIVDRMLERTGMRREQAVEILLHTYLTGDPAEMDAIFGAEAWSEVVRASRDVKKVRRTAKRVLGKERASRSAALLPGAPRDDPKAATTVRATRAGTRD